MTHFSFLFKCPFLNYPSLPNAAQPDYGNNKSDNFLLLFDFYPGEKLADKIFWSVLVLVG